MSRYLLDTDSIIDLLVGIPGTVDLVHRPSANGGQLCSCAVTIGEVYAGLELRHQAAAERFLSDMYFLATSQHAARQAGVWRYVYRRGGIQLALTDCLIAAVAAEHDTTVVTGNIRHFPQPDLKLLSIRRAR